MQGKGNSNPGSVLKARLGPDQYAKLARIENTRLHAFLADAIELCRPESVFICTDAPEDIAYVRGQAVVTSEERSLAMEGHTVHFDGYFDQARDKANTRYLLPPGVDLGSSLNSIDRQEGLSEVRGFLAGSMKAREMIVRFFCLGPTKSAFSISGVQVTDSFYVAHSEDLLFRPGFEQFKSIGDSAGFFRVIHSSGRLKGMVSADVKKRRVYIDIADDCVYSVNTQYAGNTVGFKKLALRLAIRKADREGWLAEHMFVMGAHGPKGRVTYFSGAFPSACGKTSTAMLEGETIIGDDVAYLRPIDGVARAVNVERGIFGIIRDVNPSDDPLINEVLSRPGEVIFSNVLVKDGVPYWLGMGRELPAKGMNFSGEWFAGKLDADGNEVPPAHKNARYTVALADLANLDPLADDPAGVPLGGIIYGGRDSDCWPPVQQSFDWTHGVVTMAASLESETTSATLGQEGVRSFQPMSNLDFVSLPLGRYMQNHLDFAGKMKAPPLVFAVNYFIRGRDGQYLTDIHDKAVWLKWMELRVHGEVAALRGPTGLIPVYDDLAELFRRVLSKEYTREQYEEQFKVRVRESVAKMERISGLYRAQVADTPEVFFRVVDDQVARLRECAGRHGDYAPPGLLPAE